MAFETLAARILKETGIAVTGAADADALAGMFVRYRPLGAGLERLLVDRPAERAVRDRLKATFAAAADAGGGPQDPYLLVRGVQRPSDEVVAACVASWLAAVGRIADLAADGEALGAVALSRATGAPPRGAAFDNDRATLFHETVADFVARWQPGASELFLLKEAAWSLANDYFLMAWILWPAHALPNELPLAALDGFFEAWRLGLRVVFFAEHEVGAQSVG